MTAPSGADGPVVLATCTTDAPDATRALGRALAGVVRAGDIVLLAGDLGAGKTTLAQGFAAGLGVTEPVTSPTFVLVRPYRCAPAPLPAPRTLLHADLYRLDAIPEVLELGLAELVEDGAVALVEWGDVAAGALGPDLLEVRLTAPGTPGTEDERRVTVSATGRWVARADLLCERLGVAGPDSGQEQGTAPSPP